MEKQINKIPGFESISPNHYISDSGEVISYRWGKRKVLKLSKNSKGYLRINLFQKELNKARAISIHRLVAMAFIPNPENKEQVNHLNGKNDNSVENLEWVSNHENREHAIKTGLKNEINYNIAQYDLESNLLNVFYTAQDALSFLGISNKRSGNIGRCIKGERKTAYGYIWKQY